MANEGDMAQAVIEREEEIREMQRRAAAAIPKAVSDECVECDTPISKERQEATGGTEYCVDCQSANEIRGSQYVRR